MPNGLSLCLLTNLMILYIYIYIIYFDCEEFTCWWIHVNVLLIIVLALDLCFGTHEIVVKINFMVRTSKKSKVCTRKIKVTFYHLVTILKTKFKKPLCNNFILLLILLFVKTNHEIQYIYIYSFNSTRPSLIDCFMIII